MDEVSFADWTERFKAYIDYIKALGQYKLSVAQAEKVAAETANELAAVRAKLLVIRQLERDLRAFQRTQNGLQQEIARIKQREKNALLFLRGTRITSASFTKAWAGYTWFESRAFVEVGEALFDIAVPSAARTAANFVATRTDGNVVEAPADVENALQLMDFLKSHRFIAKRGGQAQCVVVQLYIKINSVAEKTVAEIEQRLSEIRQKTYQAWNFNALLGVPENAAARRIEAAGAS